MTATVARITRQWSRGKLAKALEAIVQSSDTRSAAELALAVYARLQRSYGSDAADQFRRAVER